MLLLCFSDFVAKIAVGGTPWSFYSWFLEVSRIFHDQKAMKRPSPYIVLVALISYLFSVALFEVAHNHPLIEGNVGQSTTTGSSSVQANPQMHYSAMHDCPACIFASQRFSTVPTVFGPQAPTLMLSLATEVQLPVTLSPLDLCPYKRGPPLA